MKGTHPDYAQWLLNKIGSGDFSHQELASRLIDLGFKHPHGGVDWDKFYEYARTHNLKLQGLKECSEDNVLTTGDPASHASSKEIKKVPDAEQYKLAFKGLLVSQWLKPLTQEKKEDAFKCILELNNLLNGEMEIEIENSDGDYTDVYAFSEDVNMAARHLAETSISSFSIDLPELFFSSWEAADSVKQKLLDIFFSLNLIIYVSGNAYLNLGAVDPSSSDKWTYKIEMEELIEAYYSLLPRRVENIYS